MAVFLVAATSDSSERVGAAIANGYAESHYPVADGQWLFAAQVSAEQLSQALGIGPDNPTNAIVVGGSAPLGLA